MSGATFATRLADREHNFRTFFTVQGIEPVFVEERVATTDPDVFADYDDRFFESFESSAPFSSDWTVSEASAMTKNHGTTVLGSGDPWTPGVSDPDIGARYAEVGGSGTASAFTTNVAPFTSHENTHAFSMRARVSVDLVAGANARWALMPRRGFSQTSSEGIMVSIGLKHYSGGGVESEGVAAIRFDVRGATGADADSVVLASYTSNTWVGLRVDIFPDVDNSEETIKIYKETYPGSESWTLLHEETWSTSSTKHTACGYAASDRRAGLWHNSTGGFAQSWSYADGIDVRRMAWSGDGEFPGAEGVIEHGRTQLPVIKQIEQGESTLDLDKRRMIGGSLRVILQDTDDNDLRTLFAPMTRRATYVTSNIAAATAMTGASTLSVQNTGALASSGQVYVGGETFTYTSLPSSTSIGGVTRAEYDSIAQAHFGGPNDGAGVYEVPPAWFGRRLKFYGCFLNDDGETTSDLTSLLGTFRLEAAPRYLGDHLWELQCSELSDEYAARKCYSGFRPVEVRQDTLPVVLVGQLRLPVHDSSQFAPSDYATTYALINLNKGTAGATHAFDVREIEDITATQLRVGLTSKVTPNPSVGTWRHPFSPEGEWSNPGAYGAVHHIAILDGHAGYDMLAILASRLGTQANSTHDKLPGVSSSSFGDDKECRMGAGISIDDIDAASFIAAGDGAIGWSYVLCKETSVDEILRPFCILTGTFWYVNAQGKITLAPVAQDRITSVASISSSNTLEPPRLTYEEDAVMPRLAARTNLDPLTDEYRGDITLIDHNLASRYPNADERVEIDLPTLVLDEERFTDGQRLVRPAATRDDVEMPLRRLQLQAGRGRMVVELRCTFDLLSVGLGQAVTLSFPDTPDFEGGTLSGRPGRVVSKRPRFDRGEVELRVQLLDTLYHIAPAARIASIAGAVLTLCADTATYPELPSATPGNSFAVGWPVLVFDVSANTAYARTIEAVTSTTITLDSAPGWGALEANVDFITLDERSLAVAESGASATGFQTSDFLYQVDDSGFFGGSVSPTRFI